jgi:hypothetical protein
LSASSGRHTSGSFSFERGVEQHRHAGEAAKGVNHSVVAGVILGRHRLQPAGAVNVGDRGDLLPSLGAERKTLQHKRHIFIALKESLE